ncbi:hypothetical protein D3C76_1749780 [compost metagenome]
MLLRKVGGIDHSPFLEQSLAHSPTNAACAAGDKGDLPVQAAAAHGFTLRA